MLHLVGAIQILLVVVMEAVAAGQCLPIVDTEEVVGHRRRRPI